MRYLCDQDLYMDDGSLSFTKGKTYEYVGDDGSGMELLDNEGVSHTVNAQPQYGAWALHFCLEPMLHEYQEALDCLLDEVEHKYFNNLKPQL